MNCYRQNLPETDRQMLPVAEPAQPDATVGCRKSCRFQQGLPGALPGVACCHAFRYTFCI
ncbi:hypothetical protein [Blastopirellula marina]|uniref:Uncharacterized protein n=1 Tax=Blastopirellula marina TaxID=124 RepID=A0A2S8FCU1_9BACT|nr:hypothetical protein [Blastopirellula marina]PQO29920.1 hypothetical protein C5Y98_21905 [Blastopirellula marina]PTL42388.1 hypothetical protein C5Y97_21915 [Blastopirellula marina]